MTIQELNLLKTQAADILRTGVCFIQEGKQLSEGVLKLSAVLADRDAEITRFNTAFLEICDERDHWHSRALIGDSKEITLRDEIARLREALEQLARLGNEPQYGNSVGNRIAQAALAARPQEGKA